MTNDTGTFQGARRVIAKQTSQRKLLALDGGGMRGLITIEVLDRIESILARQSGRGDAFRLRDYFDYIAGTSTGAIIGTLLSLGMRCSEIRDLYLKFGEIMFDKGAIRARFAALDSGLDKAAMAGHWLANKLDWIKRPYSKYPDTPVTKKLQELVGADSRLGTDRLGTLLLMVLCNPQTDSPWPLSNNPFAKYNDPTHPRTNAVVPLWQLVRASTAAPTIFPPQEIHVGDKSFMFVDGGITAWNNPAFQLFLQATVEPYKLMWPTGRDKMLLVSVGTGLKPNDGLDLANQYNAETIMGMTLESLFNASNMQQDLACRSLGACVAGDPIDRELGNLIGARGPCEPLFTYARYNAELSVSGLADLGVPDIKVGDVEKLDSVAHARELARIGKAVADKRVSADHFAAFPAE